MDEGILKHTGKPVAHWVRLAKNKRFGKHSEIIQFLKAEHAFTHGYANYIAFKVREPEDGAPEGNELVAAQYEKKQELRPIYDLLIKKIQAFGNDVEVAPKKGSVSLRVKRQFALIQPTTKTRIDLGLKFNDKPVAGRLEASGPFGTMCTHRVQLTDIKQVDKELLAWLNEAYQEAR